MPFHALRANPGCSTASRNAHRTNSLREGKFSAPHVASRWWTYVAVFGVGALGSAVAGVILTRWSPTALFAVPATFATLAAFVGGYLSRFVES